MAAAFDRAGFATVDVHMSDILSGRVDLAAFFARPDTFSIGICNGCQIISNLREIVPGASHWPRFVRNLCADAAAAGVSDHDRARGC